ncbi:hypothetical protein AZE42_12385, partial [Rhizopogon vesiculosus]
MDHGASQYNQDSDQSQVTLDLASPLRWIDAPTMDPLYASTTNFNALRGPPRPAATPAVRRRRPHPYAIRERAPSPPEMPMNRAIQQTSNNHSLIGGNVEHPDVMITAGRSGIMLDGGLGALSQWPSPKSRVNPGVSDFSTTKWQMISPEAPGGKPGAHQGASPRHVPTTGPNNVPALPGEEQLSHAATVVQNTKQVFVSRVAAIPRFPILPDDQRMEYNRLLEQVFKMTEQLENQLPMYYIVLGSDNIRKLIVITLTVAHQRARCSTESPQYIIGLNTLKNLTALITRCNLDPVCGGTYGNIYRCVYHGPEANVEVAVKAIRPQFISAEVFRRELGIWKRLQHSNILKFMGITSDFGPSVALVAPWMVNGTLTSFLDQNGKSLTLLDRLHLLHDIAAGLHYLHTFTLIEDGHTDLLPVVHGDLTGTNVLIGSDRRACLADFGLSGTLKKLTGMTYLVNTSCHPGALRWTAPELLSGEESAFANTQSDIYSFGCIMLQALRVCHWSSLKMRSARKATVWLFLAVERVLTAQIPLSTDYHKESLDFHSHSGHTRDPSPQKWDLDESPAVNATGNLVFETANSLLQHWANTRHRIGHRIVPGTVSVGIILYHGALTGPHIPTALDWVATEPEYSMIHCRGTVETGCWHATFAVTRPMKVLYFDGSSSAQLPEGTMDTQDLVAWSEMKPEWLDNELQRIQDLCKWGLKNGVNGFVRMEINFEIMICDFTSHMEVISFSNLDSLRLGVGQPPNLPEDPNTMHHSFEVMHSASWRENYPGETQII